MCVYWFRGKSVQFIASFGRIGARLSVPSTASVRTLSMVGSIIILKSPISTVGIMGNLAKNHSIVLNTEQLYGGVYKPPRWRK